MLVFRGSDTSVSSGMVVRRLQVVVLCRLQGHRISVIDPQSSQTNGLVWMVSVRLQSVCRLAVVDREFVHTYHETIFANLAPVHRL